MEQLINFFWIYIPGVAAFLTLIFIVYKLLKTQAGQDFLVYVGKHSQKEINDRLFEQEARITAVENKHEERLDNIDKRLEKGDFKFRELAKDIKTGDLSNKEELTDIKGDVKMILKILLNGKEE